MSARVTATSPAGARGSERPQRATRITPRASILGVIVIVAVIFAIAPARAYLEQRAEQRSLTQQVQQLQTQNAALERQLEQLHDPVELERLARECLGLADPGEIAFVPVRHGQAPVPPHCD
jgi:cell division protein FtsB